MKIQSKYLAIALVGSMILAGNAMADVYNMGATAYFVTALSETSAATMNFGTLAALSTDTFTIAIPNGGAQSYNANVTTTGNAQHIIKSAGSVGAVKITGSGDAGVTLTVNVINGTGYTASHGVVLSNSQCSYDGAASFGCEAGSTTLAAPGSSGKYLRVGADITPDGVGNADGVTATPSIAINISYT